MSERYRTTDTTTWREVDGEIVALELKESVYYAVEGAGPVVWKLLADGATRDELIAALVDEYDVDPARAGSDVDDFLMAAVQQSLVEVVDA